MIHIGIACDGYGCNHQRYDEGDWDEPEDVKEFTREFVPNRGAGTPAEEEIAFKIEDAMEGEVKRAAQWMARLCRQHPELPDEVIMEAVAVLLSAGIPPDTDKNIRIEQR